MLISITRKNALVSTKNIIGQVKVNQTPEQALVKMGKYEASSQYEPLFGKELKLVGINDFIPNFPVKQYNIDIAIPSRHIAIEIDGGRWHSENYENLIADGKKEQELVNQGWIILRYACTKHNVFLFPLYAQQVKLLYDKLSAHPVI